MAENPVIFISHITEEAEVAAIFKGEIEAKFLGMVRIFVSSDASSLGLGRNWLDEITANLRHCASMLVFCSPYSILRPWINFECGAGWARGIEIAPLCHSGLRPVDLPLPISLLQGIEAADATKIEQVFRLIAAKLGSQIPVVNTHEISAKVREFEVRYTEENDIMVHLRNINTISSEIIALLANVAPETVVPIERVPERLVERMRSDLDALQGRCLLTYSFGVAGVGFSTRGGGTYGTLNVSLQPRVVAACISLMKAI